MSTAELLKSSPGNGALAVDVESSNATSPSELPIPTDIDPPVIKPVDIAVILNA